jgi:hypothetical protein
VSLFKAWLGAAVLTVAAATAVVAADPPKRPRPDMSCAYFSPDPDDVNGPPIRFYADLSADEESQVVESPGKGRADFVLDRKTLQFSWKIIFSDLTSPATGLAIHGPQTPGGEAGPLIDLAPKGVKSPVEGSTTLNQGLLVYLVQDRMYVQLKTAKYPLGELRSSIYKARPKC